MLQKLLKQLICNEVNSHPLCVLSEANSERTAIESNHFIHRNKSFPRQTKPIINEDNSNPSSLWKRESRRKLLKNNISDFSKSIAPGVTRSSPKVGELMLIHKAKQKSVLWSAGVVNEPIVNKGGRARAAWLKLAGSVKINNPIQHLFSIEAKSGLDRTEELTKQQKLREEKSRSKVSIPPVSNPFFLDQPVADEVVAVQPSPPRKQKKRCESRRRSSPPEDVESPAVVTTRRGRHVRVPLRFQI